MTVSTPDTITVISNVIRQVLADCIQVLIGFCTVSIFTRVRVNITADKTATVGSSVIAESVLVGTG